jgi:NAD(P)-dependent dehydrogenase (short-subunit alcohol dehydrogenase family)
MASTLFTLEGKTAIVTGASYGLGVTFAEGLSSAGANVVLVARSRTKLEQVAEKITQRGGRALVVTCDVGVPGEVTAMVEQAWQHFGRVDVLVNNAGIAADAGIMPEKVPDELFGQTIQVNLNGLWYCCREAGARMLEDGKGGSIINIASILGVGALGDLSTSYHASKGAVVNLTRHLACSWGNRGVRVNAIAPGWFPSELTGSLFNLPGFVEWLNSLAPMKRIGDPNELVGPLLFLASDASSFVTGHTLVVDGGYSAGTGASPLPEAFYQAMEAHVPNGLGRRIKPKSAAAND